MNGVVCHQVFLHYFPHRRPVHRLLQLNSKEKKRNSLGGVCSPGPLHSWDHLYQTKITACRGGQVCMWRGIGVHMGFLSCGGVTGGMHVQELKLIAIK